MLCNLHLHPIKGRTLALMLRKPGTSLSWIQLCALLQTSGEKISGIWKAL